MKKTSEPGGHTSGNAETFYQKARPPQRCSPNERGGETWNPKATHVFSASALRRARKAGLEQPEETLVGLPAFRAGSQVPPEKPTQQLLLESLPSDKTHQNKTTENSQGRKNLLPIVSSKAFSFLNTVCERRRLLAFLCMKMCCVYACGWRCVWMCVLVRVFVSVSSSLRYEPLFPAFT